MNESRYLELLGRSEKKLFCVAKAYLRNAEDCEDAYSQAILKGWHRRLTLVDESKYQAWMAKILARECLNIQRKRKREHEKLALYWQEHRNDSLERKSNVVVEQVYGLPEQQRIPIILYYAGGYSVEEIGCILGISGSLVKSRMYEGRKKLRIRLGDMGYGTSGE